jgi:peptidoglycan/xylan/chitin deacetylase (PgdA/CDA1 family)
MRVFLRGAEAKVGEIVYHTGGLKLFSRFASKFQLRRQPTGEITFPFVQRRKSTSLQILTYHRVNDEGDPFFPAVSTQQFAAQMEHLAEDYCPCGLEDAVERLQHHELPERAIVVTFDDGYRDNYCNAFPILQRCAIPATIFLATGAIGTGGVIWHDRVFRAFRSTKVAALDFVRGIEMIYPLTNINEKRTAQARILQLLWNLAEEDRLDRIEQLEKRLEVDGAETSASTMLSWDEVALMLRGGVAFGSHTISHPILSKLTDRRLREEIEDSKKIIESKTQKPVKAFAYPVGRREDFDDRAKHILKEAGYECGVTTIFGVNEIGQDPFELRRGSPWRNDIASFAARLSWYKFAANG